MMTPDQHKKCFGCTREDLERMWNSPMVQLDPMMAAMGMASDAQEEMQRGMTEQARQTLNRQKWLLGKLMDLQRVAKAK